MPIQSITTTATDVFFGSSDLSSISFRHGGSTGTIYLRNKQVKQNTVSSTDYDWSLSGGNAIGLTFANDGDGITGPWQAVSDTGGGLTLEILPIFFRGRRGK